MAVDWGWWAHCGLRRPPEAENMTGSGAKMSPKMWMENADLDGKIGVASVAAGGFHSSESRVDPEGRLLLSWGPWVLPHGASGALGGSFASPLGPFSPGWIRLALRFASIWLHLGGLFEWTRHSVFWSARSGPFLLHLASI